MNKEEFLAALRKEAEGYNKIVATDDGDWIVKGFIDVYKKIYTISVDTKVVSKVIEILLIPAFEEFAKKNGLILENQTKQNFYPDLTFISKASGEKFAVDIKSTIKDSDNNIKGMTLGTYQGYFQKRNEKSSISYPYSEYSAHIVFGVLYSQIEDKPNEKDVFDITELNNIKSVIKDFQFFVQPKYKIAAASKGSGNTRNIGSTRSIDDLINGNGIFSTLGEDVFDDYWMYFIDKKMSQELSISRPYENLKTYLEYKEKSRDVLEKNKKLIEEKESHEQIDIDEDE